VVAKLYSVELSHPSLAARLTLERKGIEHRVVSVLPGFHPMIVRALGFPGATVPALRIGGRRVQGTLEISRFLEELRASPRLFPADPEERRAVEEAERWGEQTFQPIPRRLFRWGTARHQYLRRWVVEEVVRMPLPGFMAWSNAPVARNLARISDARDDAVRGDLASLPDLLAHADALIADGTIGGHEPNAADFQIATTVRVLLAYEDLRDAVSEHPVADLARRIVPDYPEPIPSFLPPAWL
jgi:glutathione S-transferase